MNWITNSLTEIIIVFVIVGPVFIGATLYFLYKMVSSIFNTSYKFNIYFLHIVFLNLQLTWWFGLFKPNLFIAFFFPHNNKIFNYLNSSHWYYIILAYFIILSLITFYKIMDFYKLKIFKNYCKTPLLKIVPDIEGKFSKNKLKNIQKINIVFSHFNTNVFTFGYFNPIIVFPIKLYQKINPQEIENIVLHEIHHIINKDFLHKIWLEIQTTLLFANPLTYILKNEFSLNLESRVDSQVLAQTKHSRIYFEALLKILSNPFHENYDWTLNIFKFLNFKNNSIVNRLENVLNQKDKSSIFNLNSNNLKYVFSFCSIILFAISSTLFLTKANLNSALNDLNISQLNFFNENNNINETYFQTSKQQKSELLKENDLTILNKKAKLPPLAKSANNKPNIDNNILECDSSKQEDLVEVDQAVDYNEVIDLLSEVENITIKDLKEFYRKKYFNQKPSTISLTDGKNIDTKLNQLIFISIVKTYAMKKNEILTSIQKSKNELLNSQEALVLQKNIILLELLNNLTIEMFAEKVAILDSIKNNSF